MAVSLLGVGGWARNRPRGFFHVHGQMIPLSVCGVPLRLQGHIPRYNTIHRLALHGQHVIIRRRDMPFGLFLRHWPHNGLCKFIGELNAQLCQGYAWRRSPLKRGKPYYAKFVFQNQGIKSRGCRRGCRHRQTRFIILFKVQCPTGKFQQGSEPIVFQLDIGARCDNPNGVEQQSPGLPSKARHPWKNIISRSTTPRGLHMQ